MIKAKLEQERMERAKAEEEAAAKIRAEREKEEAAAAAVRAEREREEAAAAKVRAEREAHEKEAAKAKAQREQEEAEAVAAKLKREKVRFKSLQLLVCISQYRPSCLYLPLQCHRTILCEPQRPISGLDLTTLDTAVVSYPLSLPHASRRMLRLRLHV